MNRNLIIIGAGCYGLSAREIAQAMGYEKVDFLDDNIKEMHDGSKILGSVDEFEKFVAEYSNIFVAMANPEIKLKLLQKIKETTPYKIATLVSPQAYIAPSAQIMQGSIVEAMAVVNAGSVIATGCIICAGSVINHCSMCCDGVNIGSNAVVYTKTIVPAGTTVECGMIFKRDGIYINDLFLSEKVSAPHGPLPINGREYCFEDGV